MDLSVTGIVDVTSANAEPPPKGKGESTRYQGRNECESVNIEWKTHPSVLRHRIQKTALAKQS
jgi:hypothetical protein